MLLRESIPKARARFDQSSLFTHIKGACTDHILNLRAHHSKISKASSGTTIITTLIAEQLKPHFAAHTLKFMEKEYVEIDNDAPLTRGVTFSRPHDRPR